MPVIIHESGSKESSYVMICQVKTTNRFTSSVRQPDLATRTLRKPCTAEVQPHSDTRYRADYSATYTVCTTLQHAGMQTDSVHTHPWHSWTPSPCLSRTRTRRCHKTNATLNLSSLPQNLLSRQSRCVLLAVDLKLVENSHADHEF